MAHHRPVESSTSAPDNAPPQPLARRFGRYLLFDHIGRGGMADIHLAMLQGDFMERRVVVKEILPELGDDDGFGRMLVAEAKLAAHLSHANVVQVFELGREAGRLFIVMEYVEGFDLNQLLRRLTRARIPLPAEFALFIVRETLRALDYAHRARNTAGEPMGIVHRDVSPSNVLISFEGEVKLCDFGIARALGASDPDAGQLSKARLAGKSAYMSPEQANGGDLDSRADVFAAGILLWELCAGRRLYKGSDEEMLELARRGDVPVLPDRGLPDQESLQQVLGSALAPDPAARFQSAAAFLEALEEYAMGAKLMASQLRFGQFLTDQFAHEIVQVRRERELAAQAERRGAGSSEGSVQETQSETAGTDSGEVEASASPGEVNPTRTADPGASPPLIPAASTNRSPWWVWAAVSVLILIGLAVAYLL